MEAWNHTLTEPSSTVPEDYWSYHHLSSSPKKAPKDNIFKISVPTPGQER